MAVQIAVTSPRQGRHRPRRRGIRSVAVLWPRVASRGWLSLLTGGVLACGMLACGGVADNGKLPPNVQDPATLHTPSGAVARYHAALNRLRTAIDPAVTTGAILTDELADLPLPALQTGQFTALDSRQDLTSYAEAPYDSLHGVRAEAREARGFLAAYAPDSSPALQAQMYALEGYADVLLADLFCSGIPLSTVDFDADYTFAAGSSTTEVYTMAAALFDSALALASDSVRIQHLAAVGRGRALLALGRYVEAASAVASVPDDYLYQVSAPKPPIYGLDRLAGLVSFAAYYGSVKGIPSVADREGANGMDYRSSGDPRIAPVLLGTGLGGGTMYYPDTSRFALSGTVLYTLANGVEARLIEAEAALQAGSGEWLTKLNALRTDGTYDTQPNANDPSQTDTLWHAGTGGGAGLRPLADPGTAAARVDLLFRERAFWLYLTGHRQGDLRRLIRQYQRAPDAVYPTGAYSGGSGGYGSELTLPVPESERTLNPKYTGCLHRNA